MQHTHTCHQEYSVDAKDPMLFKHVLYLTQEQPGLACGRLPRGLHLRSVGPSTQEDCALG